MNLCLPLTVLSCAIGEGARMPFPTTDATADYLLMTDQKHTAIPGWRVQCNKFSPDAPRRVSRRPKMQPWRFTDSEWIVWIDTRVMLKVPAIEALELCLATDPSADIWACRHRCRGNIYSEAAHLMTRPEAFTEEDWAYRLVNQIRHYAEHHWAVTVGLYELGFMAWRISDRSREFGNEWRAQYTAGCERDQLSFPISVYNTGVRVGRLPGSIAQNPIFEVMP